MEVHASVSVCSVHQLHRNQHCHTVVVGSPVIVNTISVEAETTQTTVSIQIHDRR